MGECMMRRFEILVICLLMLLSLTACKQVDESEINFNVDLFEMDKSEYRLENDRFVFKLDAATTYFSVQDKKSGAIWTLYRRRLR
jgi:hypothetical protein